MALLRTLPKLVPVSLAVLTALVLVTAAGSKLLAPIGPFPRPWWLVAFALLVTLLSLYRRPVGGAPTPGPGLGAAALPTVLVLGGATPAGWTVVAGLLLREPAARVLARFSGTTPPSEGLLLPALTGASVGGLAVFGAGTARALLQPESRLAWPALAVASLVFLLLLAALRLGLALIPEPGPHAPWRLRLRALLPLVGLGLLPDALGWGIGVLLARVTLEASGTLTLLLLAALAIPALEAARLRLRYEEARRRLSGFDRVGRAGHRMVAHGHELASVVARIDRECRNVLPAAWFRFDLLASDEKRRTWGSGPGGQLFEDEPEPPPYPPARPGFHKRAPWEVVARELEAEGTRVARITVWCDPRDVTDDDLRLFDNLLPQMAGSVHRSLLDREAKQDPLTGVAVRRELERRLERLYDRALETGGAVAVILCDLDHFKQINDTWGHAVGDRALLAAVDALESALRRKPHREDLLGRYGGEEFTVVLEDADGPVALRVAERLRRAVERMDFEEAGRRIPLTLSAGVAAFPSLHVKTASELLLLADGALYEAKNRGRNRVLLDLGRGRYKDPDGRVWEAEDAPEPPEAPRLFS